MFRNKGLYVFIEIISVELTPENPKIDSNSWELEGQLNEYIIASGVYAHGVYNRGESRITLRQETPMDSAFCQCGPDLDWPWR